MTVRLNPERLQITRDALRTGGLLVGGTASSEVRDPILRSWRRCVSAEISAEQIRTRRIERAHASDVLTRAATPVLDRLREELADLGVAVILCNRSGRIISRRVVDNRQQDRLDDNYVLEGFDYSEQTVGTNGLGTAIEEKKAVWVRGAEHFNNALQVFACVGVPILSPRGGSVAGSLSLAATAAASNPMMMSLTKFAARQVEHELRNLVYARESALAAAFSQRSSTHNSPAMLLTDDSVLSDTRLLPMMTPSSHVTLWDTVHQHEWSEPSASFVIALGGSSVPVEARRIEDADGPAYLLHFPPPPPDAGAASVSTYTNIAASPSIVDRSRAPQRVHPVPAVDAQVQRAAVSADLLALNGPRGSGRLHTASQLALATGRELLVLDATMFAGAHVHDWQAQANRALAAGNCVVIRRADQLTPGAFDGIESMAAAQSRASTPRGLLIATIDRADSSATMRELLDRFAVTVDLPALADMRECIPLVAAEILAALEPGRATQLSSSTLQALIRWSWPGNVRELRTVLIAATSSARGSVITTDDLPRRLVAAHRGGSMSGIELAERSAIVDALSRSRGNRSKAAEDLGIGRTTLYRKLRELKIVSAGEWME